MGLNCRICSNEMHNSPDPLILCSHKGGNVHLGCCINLCSQDKKPCCHALSVYEKL